MHILMPEVALSLLALTQVSIAIKTAAIGSFNGGESADHFAKVNNRYVTKNKFIKV